MVLQVVLQEGCELQMGLAGVGVLIAVRVFAGASMFVLAMGTSAISTSIERALHGNRDQTAQMELDCSDKQLEKELWQVP